MTTSSRTIGFGMIGALLLVGIITSVYAQVPGGGLTPFGGELRGTIQITGKVVCVGCSLEEMQKAHPNETNLYQLGYRDGQLVMEVNAVSEPQLWSYLAWPPRLWVRANDKLFQELTAEKNLFKEVTITGLLRTTRTLDVSNVTVSG